MANGKVYMIFFSMSLSMKAFPQHKYWPCSSGLIILSQNFLKKSWFNDIKFYHWNSLFHTISNALLRVFWKVNSRIINLSNSRIFRYFQDFLAIIFWKQGNWWFYKHCFLWQCSYMLYKKSDCYNHIRFVNNFALFMWLGFLHA